jgi:hypothetical protein
MLRKSARKVRWTTSLIVPVIATPVGPPPTTTTVMLRACLTGSDSISARSNAVRRRLRAATASDSVFNPSAFFDHSW